MPTLEYMKWQNIKTILTKARIAYKNSGNDLADHFTDASKMVLHHMGATELAANLFRSTQEEEKLGRDQVQRKDAANDVHYQAGVVMRWAIAELGGAMPEDLPTADSIKKLERAEKKRLAAPKSKGKKKDKPSS